MPNSHSAVALRRGAHRAVHPDVPAGSADSTCLGCRRCRWWWSRSLSSWRCRWTPGSGTRWRRRPPSSVPPGRCSGTSRGRPRAIAGRRTRTISLPVLPSTAADAGKVAFSVDEAVAVLFSATFVVPQVAAAALGAVAPIPATRKDRTRAARASRVRAVRREPGAQRRLRRVLRSGFGAFTLWTSGLASR